MFHVSGLLAAAFTTNEAKAPCAPNAAAAAMHFERLKWSHLTSHVLGTQGN
jgi:hypothetical protein